MSLTLPSLPEAHASLPDSAVTPVSSFRLMLLPEHVLVFVPSRHGVETTLQAVPFQWAAKLAARLGRAPLERPGTGSRFTTPRGSETEGVRQVPVAVERAGAGRGEQLD